MEAPKSALGPTTAAEALRIKADHFATYANNIEALIGQYPTWSGRESACTRAALWRSAAAELEVAARRFEAEEGN